MDNRRADHPDGHRYNHCTVSFDAANALIHSRRVSDWIWDRRSALRPIGTPYLNGLATIHDCPGTNGNFRPFQVTAVNAVLLASATNDPTIFVQIWYPAAANVPARDLLSESATPVVCSKVMDDCRLSDTRSQFPILLYAPWNGGAKDDNASTAAELASHGYVVMAIDDIDRDPRSPTATDNWQPLTFDFSSAEAFKITLRIGDRKVRRQAEKALTALDQLKACANADWRARIQFDRIGFFGFSIGGSTAAEAGTFDPRVVAVANLDGWLFGRAAFGALDKPYLVILTENAVFPTPRQLQSLTLTSGLRRC